MGLLSRDASPGLGTGIGTDFFRTLGTGTNFSGTSRDLKFALDLCPNESQSLWAKGHKLLADSLILNQE